MTLLHAQVPQLHILSKLVGSSPECFASGSEDIRSAALDAVQFLFDLSISSEESSVPHINQLLASLEPSSAPQTRSQSLANGKRKRSPSPPPPRPVLNLTPLNSLFIEGMNDEQVWAQLDLRAKNVCETLEHVLEGGLEDEQGDESADESSEDDFTHDEHLEEILKAMANGEDVELPEGVDLDSDEDVFLDESNESEEEYDEEGLDHEQEGVTGLRDPSDDENDAGLNSALSSSRRKPSKRSKKRSELDDGFFDLASFNAETEQAEAKSASRGRLGGEEDDDSDDMSIDLFTAVDEEEGADDDGVGEAMYADFFAPPSRTSPTKSKKSEGFKTDGKVRFHEEVRVKNIRAKGKNLPLYSTDDEDGDDDDEDDDDEDDDDDEIDEDEADDSEHSDADNEEFQDPDDPRRETIERLKDDLFADEEGDNPEHDLSTHEKRMADLREQISELESENVGPKDWVLMGEAGSRTRPQNSLLEEDLEFERATKAVPVITEDTVLALEERIKARISENRFDDVVRIRPMDDKPFLPSRFFELKDTKSTQSLAQIYEDEFVASQTGGVAGEDRDGKLKKEHDEIEKLWEGICQKLDALCNSYFLPKQPTAAISTVSNVSTATLESALPTSKSITTLLAPEEVFAPSIAEPRARSELTPSEKRALRGRERKAKKKYRDALDKSVDKFAKAASIGSVKRQKKVALENVVKSGKGVTVIGKPSKGKETIKKRRKP